MKDEQPYVVLTHHHDGRVLAVVVDGEHKTPQDVKDGIAALAALPALKAQLSEYRAALELCERQVTELTREIERLRFGDVTAEEEEADRVALKRFQDHLARQLRDAEEKGRVATRIEWRGYLRKAIMRERVARAENEKLQIVVAAAQAYRAAWVGSPALFPDGPLAIGAAWTDLDDALAALKGAGDA